MLIFSKPKKNVVDFFTHDPMVFEFFQIRKGTNFYPEWWRQIPNNLYESNRFLPEQSPSEKKKTLKHCPGFSELHKQSYIMPLWTELEMQINNNNWQAKVSDHSTKITSHSAYQRGSYACPSKFQHIKIDTPWQSISKKGIKFLISPCSFTSDKLLTDFFIPNAIRSYDISHGNNIHGFVEIKENIINLEAGMPFIHLFPLTDKKTQIRCHYDPEKFDYLQNLMPGRFSFTKSYFFKRHLKKLDNQN